MIGGYEISGLTLAIIIALILLVIVLALVYAKIHRSSRPYRLA